MRYKRFANSVLAGVLAAALIAVSPVSVPAMESEEHPLEENAENITENAQSEGLPSEENPEEVIPDVIPEEPLQGESTDNTSEDVRSGALSVDIPLEEYAEDIISVLLPTLSDDGESPFDFILDPQCLIFETDAAKYGGGRVEEGATLLFQNHDEGEYNFSRYSDRLKVTNQSNVPVIVTITASVDDLGEIEVVDSLEFGDSESCCMYLAIVDDEGNEQPLDERGEVSVEIEMQQAPDYAYVYRIDEENGSYTYELSTDPENIGFDSYSFGLVGYCNPNGHWEDIYVNPHVRVTWNVEPVVSEKPEMPDRSEDTNAAVEETNAMVEETSGPGAESNTESNTETNGSVEIREESGQTETTEGAEGSVVEENAVNISNTDSNDSRDNEENGTLEAINGDTADNNGGTAIGEEIRAVQE